MRTAIPAPAVLSATTGRLQSPAAASASRQERAPRDFGTGYGSSSGYGTPRSYAPRSFAPRFRCA